MVMVVLASDAKSLSLAEGPMVVTAVLAGAFFFWLTLPCAPSGISAAAGCTGLSAASMERVASGTGGGVFTW